MIKGNLYKCAFALAILCGCYFGSALATTAVAQETDDTVRVRTRVVFLDALVRDKRQKDALVSDLKQENFEVIADGKPRSISYFSREGDAGRKPLALVLALDLRRDGAGRFLRRTEVMEALVEVLSKLPAGDEVAVLALDVNGSGNREWLTRFTRNRAEVASALAVIPTLVAEGSIGTAPPPQNEDGTPKTAEPPVPQSEIDEDNSLKKEGTGEIRTVNKDGTVTVKYVNQEGAMVTKTTSKDGKVSVDIDYGFEMSAAVHEATLLTLAERPNSQPALVWVSDGIAPIPFEDRTQAEASLIQSNVIFSALVADMKTGYRLLLPLVKPITNWVGLSIYGTAQHLAKQTGGEVVRVRRPADYASGLQKIIGNLTGRYSLGFQIADTEEDDGQMHPLEVRVRNARDAKGKERKLTISARRGYFMPKEAQAAQTGATSANAAQPDDK